MKNFFEFGYTYDILYDVIEKNIKIKLFFCFKGAYGKFMDGAMQEFFYIF
jgi:hypothetical protein